jgi:selenocysteine-specific elongation factor
MESKQINITLGTAGHIDHGKTALVKLITGCDTDRLKIEKERGMTIELGFAPCTIADIQVGIVDVPGHENFIKTMVAGATGIDAVIFVIAADDGIMPQTREHLDILTLLGIKNGVVALTKSDCVNNERLGDVTEQIKKFLIGTFLEDAPILPVSNITGQGFNDFIEALEKMVAKVNPKKTDGVFRLPVERAFSLKGYGTIVSGIPVSGSIRVGDEVVLLPQNIKGRIRAMQVYKRDSDITLCGQCAAFNIPHWDYKTISRGDVVTIEGYFQASKLYLCNLKMLANGKLSLKNGVQIKFHTGTSEVSGNLFLLEGNNITAGEQANILIKLNAPVVAGPCDRFIVRTTSPVQTVGGGFIIEAIEEKPKRNNPQALEEVKNRAKAVLNASDFVEYSIKNAKEKAAEKTQIAYRAKLPMTQLDIILKELKNMGKVLNLTATLFIHAETIAGLEGKLLVIVKEFHKTNPESPGLNANDILERAQLPKVVSDAVTAKLISEGKLSERKGRLALPEHKEVFNEQEEKLIRTTESLFIKNLFNPPKPDEIIEQTHSDPDKIRRIFKILTEQQQIIEVEKGLFFHRQAIEKAKQILITFINKEGKMESVKFKYLLDTSRKFAIPLLDYFDRIGITRASGHTRYLKEK